MGSFEQLRIYEIIVIFYALSIIFYFYDFFQQDRKARTWAFWLLLVVWSLQTIFLFIKIIEKGVLPVLNLQEGLYFYVWLIVLVSIVIHMFFKNDIIVFVINLIGFILMALFFATNLVNAHSEIGDVLIGEILVAHIVIAFIAYAFYTISFACSILYLLQFYLLKKKKWKLSFKRFGSLEQLEYLIYIFIVIATPILFISLVLGISWAYSTEDLFYWVDAKTLGSFFVIIIYSLLLYKKVRKKLNGKNLAFWNTFAFAVLLMNFIFLTQLSNFHFI